MAGGNIANIRPKLSPRRASICWKRGGQLVDDLLNNVMPVQSSETTLELNLAMLKLKHTVRRENRKTRNV